jgi:hypothetical protein
VVIPIMYDLLDRKPDAAYRARNGLLPKAMPHGGEEPA